MNDFETNTTKSESDLESAILKSYDACLLNKSLNEEKDLFERYQNNTEILYQYLRAVTDDFIYPLCNEIRAMFGHLTELNQSGYTKTKELERANGHFRRLNIDALKMICDDFDQFFSKKLKTHSKYDYRSINSDYLKEFATKYFEAKEAYLLAQIEESVGSDSEKSEEKQDNDEKNEHNVIKFYHEAVKKYIVLKQFYMEHIKTIQFHQVKSNAKNIFWGFVTGFGIFVGIWSVYTYVFEWIRNLIK